MGLIVWLVYIRPQTQIFTGINLTRKPIIITIAGEQKLLNLYDTYHIATTAKGNVNLVVSDADGNLLESREYALGATPGIAIDLFTENDELAQCIVKADVTDMYYQLSTTAESAPTNMQVVAASPTLHFYTNVDIFGKEFVYPGNYAGDNLPFHVDRTTEIIGYFPVPCEATESVEEITDWITWWHDYDAAVQRELYDKQLEIIKQTTFYH